VIETRTRKNYYDQDAVNQAFGEDARDSLMDDTDGWGAARREDDGTFSRIDHHGEQHVVNPREIEEHYLSGPEGEDVV
jgi:hypothetical protein